MPLVDYYKRFINRRSISKKALGVVGKGAVASALVCAGPVGWLGLVGFSLANSYGKAAKQGNPSSSLSVKMYKKFMTL